MLLSDTYPLLKRPRRNRQTAAIRSLVQETTLTPADLVVPFFVLAEQKRNKNITKREQKGNNNTTKYDERGFHESAPNVNNKS